MNYFTEIPKELTIIIIISYISGYDISNLVDTLKLKIKNKDWMTVYSLVYPDEYLKIRNIINFDPLLQGSRYTKNWEEFVINDRNMTPELCILFDSSDIYEEFPQFYSKIKELPKDLKSREYLSDTLHEINNEITYGDIRDQALIEYFNTGILTEQPDRVETDLSLTFIYIMMLDGFTMNLHIFYKFIKLLRDYDSLSDIYTDRLIYSILQKLSPEYRDKFNKEAPHRFRQ
jgi:hypothetical protein